MTQGQHSAKYASGQHARANGYLFPFFGSMVLPEITAGKVNEYRVHRLEECKALRGKPSLDASSEDRPNDRPIISVDAGKSLRKCDLKTEYYRPKSGFGHGSQQLKFIERKIGQEIGQNLSIFPLVILE